ncbi:MAG: hypothetical protein E6J62_00795 [Deltaproteobacteria bacterium]|nr:MAG: hypothetical protein E6J62_00795 [Deltaproteobacteria bacterium]
MSYPRGMGARQPIVALLLAAGLGAPAAFADGAFPDELSVMLPEVDPNRILVGANFGLVVSPDAGASWRYVCEPFITGAVNDNISFYKAGSDGTVLATSFVAFWRSADGGCTWTRAGGTVSSNVLTRDLFIDPNDPLFVLAIVTELPAATNDSIHQSVDGGRTFTGPAYRTANGNRLSGVEIAGSDPNVVYATELQDGATVAVQAFLLKSIDHGATFPKRQRLNVPSGTEVRIAAVDALNPAVVYLRLISTAAGTDAIAMTSDDGLTLSDPPFTILAPTAFSTFLVAANGTLFAGTTSSDLYAAPQGTTAFVKRTGPRARCLGQRPGSSTAPIYACGDGFLDGYNLGVSDDGAQTFRPLMKFTQIAGPLTCPAVSQGCAAQFALLQQTLGVTPPPGGAGGGGGTPSASKSGCGSAGGDGAALSALALAAGYLKWLRRRGTTRRRAR